MYNMYDMYNINTLQGNAVGTFFLDFLGKCRSCVPLNKITQNFMCKIQIIKNNNDTFYVNIVQ